MSRILMMAAIALALALTSQQVSAQAACPSSNRLGLWHFPNGGGEAQLNLNDGARYRIIIGSINPRNQGSSRSLTAIVFRNEVCLPPQGPTLFFLVRRGTEVGGNALTGNSNLCLGGADDNIQILSSEADVNGCNGSFHMFPVNYAGFRLSIYGGSGNDWVQGGGGNDSLYGGNGNDIMLGASGSDDRLYGEGGNDYLLGSSATSLWLDGGSGNDFISTTCRSATVICGTGTDSVQSPDLRPWFTDCETWGQGC